MAYSGAGREAGDRVPLASVLQLALEFAKSGAEGGEQECGAMQVDSPCPSPRSALTPASSTANLSEATLESPPEQEPHPMEVEQQEQPLARPKTGPQPRLVSELELKVLSSCLSRWSREVEEEVAMLNSNLREIEERIQGMYEDEGLRQRGYRLHAVMVHEGDAQQVGILLTVILPLGSTSICF